MQIPSWFCVSTLCASLKDKELREIEKCRLHRRKYKECVFREAPQKGSPKKNELWKIFA